MLEFANGGRLIEFASELPVVQGPIETLYLDMETSSAANDKTSLNPWHTCWPCGLAVTWDNMPYAFYVPVVGGPWLPPGPTSPIDRAAAYAWLRDLISRSRCWENHHVKYDAHVYCNNIGPQSDLHHLELRCTILESKIVDSDRQFVGGYGLDALSSAWLHDDIHRFEERLKPYLHKNKDYGRIPYDILGEYACQDVLTNRRLGRYTKAKIHEECHGVLTTERQLTSVLLDMEQRGIRVDQTQLQLAELRTIGQLLHIEEKLHKLTGRCFNPISSDDCHEIICGRYGLPVVSWTNSKEPEKPHNPSFDKEALITYTRVATGEALEVVQLIGQYRRRNMLKNLFIEPYQVEHVNNFIHPSHNQLVRTGRMSCNNPNTMQVSAEAKELFLPRPGHMFLSNDAEQIEFRTIASYTQDERVIRMYADDPSTDFHQMVADMLGIKRKQAKTMNFAVAFGQGKKSTVHKISTEPDIVSVVRANVRAAIDAGTLAACDEQRAVDAACTRRGEKFYDDYHAMFPNIKSTSKRAEQVARSRGYIRDIAGRHRHIPPDFCHIAFNTLNQGSAADIMKERMVALHRFYRSEMPEMHMLLNVHDEIVSEGPAELVRDSGTHARILAVLEVNTFGLRVPIRFACGVSRVNWREAAGDHGKVRNIDRSLANVNQYATCM